MFIDQSPLIRTLSDRSSNGSTYERNRSSPSTSDSPAPPWSSTLIPYLWSPHSEFPDDFLDTDKDSGQDTTGISSRPSSLHEQAQISSNPVETQLIVHQLLSALQAGSGHVVISKKPGSTDIPTDCITHSTLSFDSAADTSVKHNMIDRSPTVEEQDKIVRKLKAGLKFGYGTTVMSLRESKRGMRSVTADIMDWSNPALRMAKEQEQGKSEYTF